MPTDMMLGIVDERLGVEGVAREVGEPIAEACKLEMTVKAVSVVVVHILGEEDGTAEVVVEEGLPQPIPAALEVHVGYGDVGSYAFDLLGIPEGEGVVVAVGDEDGVLVAGVEHIGGYVEGGVAMAAVVVIPVLKGHKCGDGEKEDECGMLECLNA